MYLNYYLNLYLNYLSYSDIYVNYLCELHITFQAIKIHDIRRKNHGSDKPNV